MRRQPSDEQPGNITSTNRSDAKFFKKSASMEARTTHLSPSNDSLKSAIPVRATPAATTVTQITIQPTDKSNLDFNSNQKNKSSFVVTTATTTTSTSVTPNNCRFKKAKIVVPKSGSAELTPPSKKDGKMLNLPSAKSGHEETPRSSKSRLEHLFDKDTSAEKAPPTSGRSTQSSGSTLSLKFRIKKSSDKERLHNNAKTESSGGCKQTFLPHSVQGLLTPSRVTSRVTATLMGKSSQKFVNKSSQNKNKNKEELLKKAVKNQKSNSAYSPFIFF